MVGFSAVMVGEYTINDSLSHILSKIYRQKPDVVAFSCYIWNFNHILSLCQNIKQANENIKIVLGGPEVSYSPREIMQKNNFVDFIISGEGEVTIKELFDAISQNKSYNIDGVTYRKGSEIIVNNPRKPIDNFDDLPFVYDNTIDMFKNKIIYYESSRGCPFSCSYCLSGENSKVRFLSLDRVKKDIDFFMRHNVPLVKFVDRTFNANKHRAYEIFKYIIDNSKDTRFHMELAGDLLDDATIELLSTAPKDIMQFEIGVQTTNDKTMAAINRKINQDKLFCNISKLMKNGNIHIHLDLIAGLPYEDINSFKKSFNDVMSLKPHILQIGFLKLLDGSRVKEQVNEFGYRYSQSAPYEVISNDFISYDEILFLHDFEDVFEKFYNNGGFTKTLDLLFNMYDNSFEMFEDLAKYFDENGLFDMSLSKQKLYDVMYEFTNYRGIDAKEAIKFDYIKCLKSHTVPNWCNQDRSAEFEDKCHEILKDENFKLKNLPHYYDVPAKKVIKSVHFEKFSYGVLLFDHISNIVIDVTKYFKDCL